MRLYTFTNFYLSSIQQGIQPAHLISNLFIRYANQQNSDAAKLYDWATHHKTMICLNGGNAASIKQLYEALVQIGEYLNLPVDCFCEDVESLNGTMTCCGIVVPEKIYVTAEAFRKDSSLQDQYQISGLVSAAEMNLINLINSYSLAK